MKNLIFALIVTFASSSFADDSYYHRQLPAGMDVQVTVKDIELPAHADAIGFLGAGSDDFNYRISYNGRKNGPRIILTENESSSPKTYPVNTQVTLSADQDLNPYVATHVYSDHQNDLWTWKVTQGRVCVVSSGRLYQERHACFDPVIVANKMLEQGETKIEFLLENKIQDVVGDGDTYFKTTMKTRYEVVLKK